MEINNILDELQVRLDPNNRRGSCFLKPLPRIYCNDGFFMDIQADQFEYCIPQNDIGPYTHVCVDSPSDPAELLAPYAHLYSNSTHEVFFPYVPLPIVARVIEIHSGLFPDLGPFPMHLIARVRLRCTRLLRVAFPALANRKG